MATRRASLPVVYFCLAAFDVVAISATLVLTSRLVATYAEAVSANRRWTGWLGHLTALSSLAGEVNDPGNEVFESHDPPREKERLRAAVDAFGAEVRQIRAALEGGEVGAPDGTLMAGFRADLEAVDVAMRTMIGDAERTLVAVAEGRIADAGLRMAAMDRTYGHVTARLGQMTTRVHELQRANLAEQQRAAQVVERLEYVIGLLVVLMVCGIGAYGIRLARAFTVAAQEREAQALALARQAEELASARDDAVAATRAKSAFLAAVSHELRTPMQGIIGMTDLLLGSTLTPDQRDHTRLARSSAERLLGMVNDVLEFSRSEAGRLDVDLDLVDFDLEAAIEDVVSLLAATADAENVAIHCVVDPAAPRWVRADGDRIRQVLVNLISNAVKFTRYGDVVVRLGVDPATGHPRIEVEDTGDGVPAEARDRVFEPFYRAPEAEGRLVPGTGIGLAIARRLVEAMRGTIGFRSGEVRGSLFWFTFAPERPNIAPIMAPSPPMPRRVLWIDQNETSRRVAEEQLRAWAIDLHTTSSTDDALTWLRSCQRNSGVDVIVLDAAVGGASFDAFVSGVRRLPATERVRLVVIAPRDGSDRLRVAAGSETVERPVRPSRLREILGGPARRVPVPPHDRLRSESGVKASRVLVAEDEPIIQKAVRKRLVDMGCQVDLVDDGARAIEAAGARSYDLVILDVQLRGVGGVEAAIAIRAIQGCDGWTAPIVAMTAQADGRDRARFLAAGMDDCLVKPFALDAFTASVRRWLGRS